MLCNDPPWEVHVELLQVICHVAEPSCSLDDDLGSLTSPPAGRTTPAHGHWVTLSFVKTKV